MDNVTYDRATGVITGVDRQPLPFEGEIKLPFDISPIKTVWNDTGLKVQKKNELDQLLYLDNVEVDGNDNLISATEVTYGYKEVDGNLVELPPASEPLLQPATYKLQENTFVFNTEDVVNAKKNAINKNNFRKLDFYSEDLVEVDFTADATQDASMGIGFIAINPGGQVTTQAISLAKAVDTIETYLEAQEGIEMLVSSDNVKFIKVTVGSISFNAAADKVYVRFTNTADTRRELYAFGILV